MLAKQKGFTIVELLIVIVIIGILAAIVIVSFNGVQNRAKTTASDGLASNVKKAAEVFMAVNGRYPSVAELTSSTDFKLSPDSFTTSAASPTTEKHVRYVQCISYQGIVTGSQLTWKKFPTGEGEIISGMCS